ncbi:Necessary for protein translocation in the endoplasmic reticulum [Nakaseomyces bracarensis]|uniref:Necessary for protein translocation in the endoplasmic reticulum n=1 Tax=Nakaseomyces bracarensis TaxID=273131 RepID=A0ABR4NVW6_9SACH
MSSAVSNNTKPVQRKKEVKEASPAIAQKNKNSILKIYSDEAKGLRVDPLVVLFLAVGFIFSVVGLHVISKLASKIF